MSKKSSNQGSLQFPEASQDALAILRAYQEAPTVEVLFRSAVGACIPFTVLPERYLGKKVKIVIAGEADE